MNFLKALSLIFSMLPMIEQAITQIETLFPQGGIGQQKLDMVKAIIEKASSAFGIGDSVFESIWPMISASVSAVVSMKNSLGSVATPSIAIVPSTPVQVAVASATEQVLQSAMDNSTHSAPPLNQ